MLLPTIEAPKVHQTPFSNRISLVSIVIKVGCSNVMEVLMACGSNLFTVGLDEEVIEINTIP